MGVICDINFAKYSSPDTQARDLYGAGPLTMPEKFTESKSLVFLDLKCICDAIVRMHKRPRTMQNKYCEMESALQPFFFLWVLGFNPRVQEFNPLSVSCPSLLCDECGVAKCCFDWSTRSPSLLGRAFVIKFRYLDFPPVIPLNMVLTNQMHEKYRLQEQIHK